MKVVYDSEIFIAQQYGGISRYFTEIASKISKSKGVDISVIAPFYINDYLRNLFKCKVHGYAIPNISYLRFIARKLDPILTEVALPFIRPDIIHTTYYSQYKNTPVNAKCVITIHDMIHEKLQQML